MKAEYLTPQVREQVLKAVHEIGNNKKSLKTNDDVKNLIYPFYDLVKHQLENNYENFSELCILEMRYGFVRGYLGGSNINTDGDTVIKIG